MKKILSPAYSLKLKNIILFFNRGLIFFSNGHIRNVVSTLPNVVKIDVENDNVVSTLSNIVQFNVEKHNVVSGGNCGFGHVYGRNPQQKTSFFVQGFYTYNESDDGDNDDENYNKDIEAVVPSCSSK